MKVFNDVSGTKQVLNYDGFRLSEVFNDTGYVIDVQVEGYVDSSGKWYLVFDKEVLVEGGMTSYLSSRCNTIEEGIYFLHAMYSKLVNYYLEDIKVVRVSCLMDSALKESENNN